MEIENNKIILVAEDDNEVSVFIKNALEENGYKCYIVNNGKKVVSQVKEKKPDLIILDMVLPEKSGAEIIHELNKELLSYIPVIVMSGKYEANFLWKMLKDEANVRECFVKPVSIKRLIKRVNDLLDFVNNKPDESGNASIYNIDKK